MDWCGIKCQKEHREHDPLGCADIEKSTLRLDEIRKLFWERAFLVLVGIIIIAVIVIVNRSWPPKRQQFGVIGICHKLYDWQGG